MIELLILRGVRRGFSRNATLAFWRADSGLFRRLVGRVPWKGSSEWQRSPANLDIAQKRNLEDAGARCLRVLKDMSVEEDQLGCMKGCGWRAGKRWRFYGQ